MEKEEIVQSDLDAMRRANLLEKFISQYKDDISPLIILIQAFLLAKGIKNHGIIEPCIKSFFKIQNPSEFNTEPFIKYFIKVATIGINNDFKENKAIDQLTKIIRGCASIKNISLMDCTDHLFAIMHQIENNNNPYEITKDNFQDLEIFMAKNSSKDFSGNALNSKTSANNYANKSPLKEMVTQFSIEDQKTIADEKKHSTQQSKIVNNHSFYQPINTALGFIGLLTFIATLHHNYDRINEFARKNISDDTRIQTIFMVLATLILAHPLYLLGSAYNARKNELNQADAENLNRLQEISKRDLQKQAELKTVLQQKLSLEIIPIAAVTKEKSLTIKPAERFVRLSSASDLSLEKSAITERPAIKKSKEERKQFQSEFGALSDGIFTQEKFSTGITSSVHMKNASKPKITLSNHYAFFRAGRKKELDRIHFSDENLQGLDGGALKKLETDVNNESLDIRYVKNKKDNKANYPYKIILGGENPRIYLKKSENADEYVPVVKPRGHSG